MTELTLLEFGLAVERNAKYLWLALAVGALLALAGAVRIGIDRLDRLMAAADEDGPYGLAAADSEDGKPDDLMNLADKVFGDDVRPVNEPRPGWDRLDGRNRGAWLDHVSRTSNTQNARWITGRQQEQAQEQAGATLADGAAAFLASPQAERELQQIRHERETTGEIRRGDPGE